MFNVEYVLNSLIEEIDKVKLEIGTINDEY